ncbi:MAG: HAMP domain-containing protein [Bdellovibrionales bacterium]|nr:HAMP domain-containing protein [Bdellovibrionales bacterium]
MIATFLPLAGLPLIALAVLTYFLVGRALDQEITRRATPELSAFARSLETIEQRLGRQLATLARSDEFTSTLRTRNESATEVFASRWVLSSQFDTVRIHAADGTLLATIERTDKGRTLDSWTKLFAARDPASEPVARANAHESTFAERDTRAEANSQTLPENFRNFLRTEESWSVREISESPRHLRLAIYRAITNSAGAPLGYVEGQLNLDNDKIAILARFQGVEIALVDKTYQVLGASTPEAAQKLSGVLSELRLSGESDWERTPRTVQTARQPLEFFFAPLVNAPATKVWAGVGISKNDQTVLRNKILLWVSLLALSMASLVVALTFALSNRITRPMTELVKAVEAMRQGEWVQPVQAETKTEVGFLVKRFNEMALSVQATKRMLETKLGELAEAHDALKETQEQLIQSAKMSSLGQLVAGVAHELNNPIAFIYSNMSQMRQYLKNIDSIAATIDALGNDLTPEARAKLEHSLADAEWDYIRKDMTEIVRSSLEGSVRVKDIVLGLRNFSRLDKGDFADADLHQALQNTVKLLASQIRNRVEVVWDLRARPRVECNLSQINQVFMNLVANALQAIEGPGHVWISTHDDTESDSLVLSVRDDGKGIAPEHRDRIFDPFFTTKKVGDGTGLGLSIVYGIIERHRGSIRVVSSQEPGERRGTEFIVTLPRRAAPRMGQSTDAREAS